MASSQNSPVLVQHASPPHTLSPSVTVVSIAAFPPDLINDPAPLPEPVLAPASPTTPNNQDIAITAEESDTVMADAPSEAVAEILEGAQPLPPPEPQPAESAQLPADSTTPPGDPPVLEEPIPPPPPQAPEELLPEVPEWATWDDDLSVPNEEEMREINARDSELSALDVSSVEKRIYQDVDDPDQRPVKKLRLSWVIRNLRGNRQKPNHARIMVSPPAEIDGNYWQIKFYPRGNKVSSLSAYIKCSRTPPKPTPDVVNSTFSFYEGSPDADLGAGAVPVRTMTTEAENGELVKDNSSDSDDSQDSQKSESSQDSGGQAADLAEADSAPSANVLKEEQPVDEAWRVPAQLGVIIYNPDEPRTCAYMSSEHQFSHCNDDWGWTNFYSSWRDLHLRQHAQRAPLLRNDTIAIDAYIRIFDDPSQALWWRASDSEPFWDSRLLTGYYPMGTPPLYHSPAVAGMTAWLLLAPFYRVIQTIDGGAWRKHSQIRPRPIICHLQMITFLMRSLRKERETYVDVYPVVQALKEHGESFNDVLTFWEALRRAIELELEDDPESVRKIADILGSAPGPLSLPPLPVEGVSDIQQGLSKVLEMQRPNGRLPDFLPLALAREKFDKRTREWKLLHDRVILNDQVTVADGTTEGESESYTLYGFMVHVGERNSGKIYTVLRPRGPSTKWLAFEDGDGNKIFSYTKKRVQEFEGLEGQALKDFTSTRQTAYLAMYIRSSRINEYLPGALEPYKLPKWLLPYFASDDQDKADLFLEDPVDEPSDTINVEIYSEEGLVGRQGLLDMFNIKKQTDHKGLYYIMPISKTATFQELRTELSTKLDVSDAKRIRLFIMNYTGMGNYASAQMHPVDLSQVVAESRRELQPFCLWYALLKSPEETELFGDPDRPAIEEPVQTKDDPNVVPSDGIESNLNPEGSGEVDLAAADAEQDSVHEAVAADLERLAETPVPGSSSEVQAVEDVDTPMQLEMPPTVEESALAEVPHGHLIDAANHQSSNMEEATAANTGQLPEESVESAVIPVAEENVTAAATTQDAEPMDFTMESGSENPNTEPQATDASGASSSTSLAQTRPVRHIYGFIQVLDLEKQTFSVHGGFFAEYDEKVKDFIRQRMGYDAEKEFNVWRRESVVEGSLIGVDETFADPQIINGVDLIVGEVISDTEAEELGRQGKFSDPFALSRYLRMVERKHPIESVTSVDPVEIAHFGTDYYKGPLVNGQAHGEHCLCISSSGNTYDGPLIGNKKCGKGGKMIYQNGDTYDGEWHADERHGQGTYVEHRTGNKYVGGFEYGKRWGMGTTYWQVADEQADLCQICYGEEIDALFFDCGHVCSCVECARQCEICPICRRTVKQVVKMFRA